MKCDQFTVEVMIMSRDRYRFRANVNQRDIKVTDRYRILPLLALQALPVVI